MSNHTKLRVNLRAYQSSGGNDGQPSEPEHNEHGGRETDIRPAQETTADAPNTGVLTADHSFASAVRVFGFVLLSAIFIYLLISLLSHRKNKQKRNNQYISYKRSVSHPFSRFFVLVSLLTLGVFAASYKDLTFADTTTDLALNASSILTLNANILGTDNIAYIKDTIKITEDSPYGYDIYLTADNNKLINQDNPSIIIDSLKSAGPLANNTFGYSCS